MPAPTTQTSARVFLSNADDRMIGEVATQTEAVLRRLDKRFATVLFLEGRLDFFFVMIGKLTRASAPSRIPHQKLSGPRGTYAHLAAGVASKSVKSAKARSGYRVQSLRKGTRPPV
jgi:hypothetical protein